jgi:hypothetical protein
MEKLAHGLSSDCRMSRNEPIVVTSSADRMSGDRSNDLCQRVAAKSVDDVEKASGWMIFPLSGFLCRFNDCLAEAQKSERGRGYSVPEMGDDGTQAGIDGAADGQQRHDVVTSLVSQTAYSSPLKQRFERAVPGPGRSKGHNLNVSIRQRRFPSQEER